MKISRRDFVKAGSLGGAALAVFPPSILAPKSASRAKKAIPVGDWVASGCNGCVGWCPLMVRVVEGKAVEIAGNPNSTWTGGKLCPRGLLSLQILYDPDRVKTPLKRTNPNKGRDQDPGWVAISWDEALNTIVDRMRDLRDKKMPERFAMFRGRYDTLSADLLYSRLAKAYGTPNAISHSAICSETSKAGNWYARGKYAYSAFDFENTSFILSFGVPLLESNRPTSGNLAAWSKGRGRRSSRPKTVVVDPRYSVSAARADEWVPINPGTDGALALGIAHVILKEGLWDRKFVGNFKDAVNRFVPGKLVDEPAWQGYYTSGLVQWWNLYLKDFNAVAASKETGIPEATIERLAREFATTRPAVTVRGRGSEAWPGNGTYNSYAIYALNGLVGSVDVKGGTNHYSSVNLSPELLETAQDDLAKSATKKPRIDEKGTKKFPYADVITNNAADNILKEFPYPIEMALGWWNNWAFSAPGSNRWEQVLDKVPFVVHHTSHLSEWSMYSDIVLPAKTYLEKWGAGSPAGGSTLYVGLTLFQPVVEPLYDTMSEVELALALGQRLGEHYPSIKKSFEGIGGPYGDTAEGYTKARTQEVWDKLPGKWDEFRKKGTVNSGAYKFKWEFDTPSKRFEFYSDNLKELFEKLKVTEKDLDTYYIKARGDLVYVPHYETPIFIGDKTTYPLSLVSYKNALNQEGRSQNAPWAQELYLSPLHGEAWTNFAEINPETAKKFGIADGDTIFIESQVGKIKARVKLFEGVHPEIVAMCFGQGHWAYGKWAKDKGSNPNEITGVMYEHITGMSAYFNTRVKVYKA